MVIACPDCAALQNLPVIPGRGQIACYRCGRVLERRAGRNLDAALACALAGLLLLFPANLLPLALIRPPGAASTATYLASGCALIWEQGWPLVAVVLGLQGLVLPFLRFGTLVVALGALRLRRQPRWVGRLFRYTEHLDLWAMPDVLLLGAALGYGRVAVFIPVHLQAGGFCLIGSAILTMLSRATLDRRMAWRRIAAPADPITEDRIACTTCDLIMPGEPAHCARCGARLHRRKPWSLKRTNALLVTVLVLLPIAGGFPASSLWQVGLPSSRTIFEEIRLLFQSGYAPVGALILCTSVGAPLLKIGSLAWFSLSVTFAFRRGLLLRTKLSRVVEALSRWSYVDPFSVMVFAPMLQFPPLVHVTIGSGSPAFVAVLVISSLAVKEFDPRLMWDAAGFTDLAGPNGAPGPRDRFDDK